MLGLSTEPSLPMYDLAVIGGGPAGLASAVYGASEGLETVLIEKHHHRWAGGPQFADRELPGVRERHLRCIKLTTSARQAGRAVRRRGDHHPRRRQASRRRDRADHRVRGRQHHRRPVGDPRDRRRVPGAARSSAAGTTPTDPDGCNYVGRGVYYGASVSDAEECRDEDVYIVGGANSAGQAAMFMSKTAKSVTLLVRGPVAGGLDVPLPDRADRDRTTRFT